MSDREPLVAYLYNPQTGAYAGTDIAPPDPLEDENYLVPANSTLTAPPDEEAGKAIFWRGAAWEKINDDRGTVIYNTTTGKPITVTEIAQDRTGYTELSPEGVQFPKWNGSAWVPDTDMWWATIRAQRDRLLTACDWTQIGDAPLTSDQKTAWIAYRVSLRGIPEAFTNPADVTWPTPPT